MRNAVASIGVIFVLSAACFAQDMSSPKGLPFNSKTRTGFTWMTTDAIGNRWDINYNGSVNDGTNDAYDGGMTLAIGGSAFSWGSQGLLSADRREVQVGPWQYGQLKIWRRIYVAPKGAYCRWIDIFENTASSNQTCSIRYQTYCGGGTVGTIQNPAGKDALAKGDGAFLTNDGQNGSSRPNLCHVFFDRGAKVAPKAVQVARGNNSVTYDFELAIPAGQVAALCFFESQQRSLNDAQAFLKKFRPAAELAGVPADLRKIIANMGGAFFSAGGLEMARNDKLDLAVLREGDNELLGTIMDANFVVQTVYGTLTLGAERVIGLVAPHDTEAYVQIALTDGQIVAGKLLNDPVKLKLENGSEMSLPVAKLSTLAYRVCDDKPTEVNLTRPTILTRAGQRLYFKASDLKLAYLTEAGQLDLKADDLATIHTDTPDGGLHRAIFRNTSILAGLLVEKDVKVALDLGPAFTSPASSVSQFIFPSQPAEMAGLSEINLRNEDTLFGRVAQETLEIKTRFGTVKVAREDLAELRLAEGGVGRVDIKLHNGTTVSGQYADQKIRFKVEPGPEVAIFIGHIVKITCPKPPPPPPTQPATGPGADPNAKPATRPATAVSTTEVPVSSSEGAADNDAVKKKIQDEIAKLTDEHAAMRTQSGNLAQKARELRDAGKKEEASGVTAEIKAVIAQQAKLAARLKELENRLAEVNHARD
jgi:hypothetical protein